MAIFKKDWKAGDRPVSADANRWESNTEEAYNLADAAKYWGQLMHISGNVGGNANQTIERDAVVPVQTVCVYVKPRPVDAPGTSLNIRFIGFNLNPAFRLRIQVEGESSYFQSLSESDYYDAWYNGTVTPTLFVNETDSPVKKRIIISVVNVLSIDESLITLGRVVFSVVRCGNFRIIMITKNSTGANISAGFVAEAKRLVNRKPCAMVEFLWTDAAVDPLLSVESEDKNYNVIVAQGDVLKQVTDSIDRPTHEYIILDGSWVLDEGVKGLAPYTVQEVNENQIGWGSDSLSDEDGDFTEIPFPSLTVNFAGRALTSLKVVGDSLLNEYPVNFVITVYAADDELLHTETVTENTAVSWRKDISGLGINNAVKIKLEISKWSAANTIAKILEFFTVETDIFAGDEIVSLGILEERSVKNGSSPVGNISCNEIDLKLQNVKITASDGVTYKDPFSYGNNVNNRFYSFLKPNRKIIAYLGFKAGGVSEYVRMGTYWTVGDWRCNEIDFSASVTAYDRMKFLKDTTFECDEISLNLQNKNLKQVAEYVLNHAKNNIPLRDLFGISATRWRAIRYPWYGLIKILLRCNQGHSGGVCRPSLDV